MRSEDGVDERRQRLDGGCENQYEAEETQEDRQRHQPALARLAPPQAPREIDRRSRGAPQHDHPAMESATSLDHEAYSLIEGTAAATRLVTSALPATRTSMPQRRKVR